MTRKAKVLIELNIGDMIEYEGDVYIITSSVCDCPGLPSDVGVLDGYRHHHTWPVTCGFVSGFTIGSSMHCDSRLLERG